MSPTWRNDGEASIKVTNISGEAQLVPPNRIVYSYEDLSDLPDVTKLSELPAWSPNTEWTVVNLGVAGTRNEPITQPFSSLDVFNRESSSGEALVYFNTKSGEVAARLLPGRAVSFDSDEVKRRVSSVIVEASLGAVVEIIGKR